MRSRAVRARPKLITPAALLVVTLALAAPSAASGPDDPADGGPLGPEIITAAPSSELADWTPLQVLDGARGRDELRNQTTGDGTSIVPGGLHRRLRRRSLGVGPPPGRGRLGTPVPHGWR